jgi:outer membrane protein assembly factor BamE
MVSQLRKGMTREQVRFVLGTPLLTDPFHADRWDYVYSYTPGGGEEQRRPRMLSRTRFAWVTAN